MRYLILKTAGHTGLNDRTGSKSLLPIVLVPRGGSAWRHDYNHLRPHSSLGALTPTEFAVLKGREVQPPHEAKITTDSTYDLTGIGEQASRNEF